MGWKCLESLGGDELVHFHFFGSLKLFMFFLTQPTFGNLDTLSLQGTDEKGLTIFEQLFPTSIMSWELDVDLHTGL